MKLVAARRNRSRKRRSNRTMKHATASVFSHIFGSGDQLELPSRDEPHFAMNVVHIHPFLPACDAPLSVVTCCNSGYQSNQEQ